MEKESQLQVKGNEELQLTFNKILKTIENGDFYIKNIEENSEHV